MRTETQPDHYGVLGLARGASEEEIRLQYRRLAKVFHPDRNSGDAWCREQITKINLAYEALTDPARQRDQGGAAATRPGGGLNYGREAWSEAPEMPEEDTAPSGFWKRLALPLAFLSFCLAAYVATAVRALAPCVAPLHIPWLKP